MLNFEGKRDAAKLDTIDLFVVDEDRSIARLEEALVSLIEKTPRRR
ncbi:citrate lyase synthetase [Rhizobium paranaense]|uniref:Citrate lyase synthetase n=1 Tax=Rhizobium paranaense TaxID=1650438 RepID=A0A7W9D273_9HYPH|nr:citrate lyase synthetase [Rhizobium paranaense]